MENTRAIALSLVVTWAFTGPAAAATVEGVAFASSHQMDGTPLRLNGAGVLRYRVFINGYVAALYLGDGIAVDRALDDVPRRIEIEYLWSIPADAFAGATVDGIKSNVDPAALARLRQPTARLNALYQDVEQGDRYALTYLPGIGTELALNGQRLGVIEGSEFSSALFAIWIGQRPVNEPLRAALLAKP